MHHGKMSSWFANQFQIKVADFANIVFGNVILDNLAHFLMPQNSTWREFLVAKLANIAIKNI